MRKYENVHQHEGSDCAAAVISTILLTYKVEYSIMKIREIIGTDAYGTSVQGIVDGLQKLNFEVKAVRVNCMEITNKITLPAIAYVKTSVGLNHFVVIHKVDKKRNFIIADPAKEVLKLSEKEFEKIYNGILILCVPKTNLERIKIKSDGLFSIFKNLILPNKAILIAVIISSFILSILGIVVSLYSKILFDEIIPYELIGSLFIFLCVFSFITLIQNLLSFLRQQTLLYLSRKIDIPLLLSYYNHIIRLPYFFFATRKTGDILTRFQDAMTIKNILTSVSVTLILDITLSLLSAMVLFVINKILFSILIFVVIVNIILIYSFKKPYKKINYEQLESSSVLNSQIIESLKNIETVKALHDEQNQIERLEFNFVNLLKIDYKEGTLRNIQNFVSNFVGATGNIIFMGVGAYLIIKRSITIGDLIVFQSLSQFFIEPVQNLVNLQLTFQEASIAMKRLEELMSLDREDEETNKLNNISLVGDINIINCKFGYGSRPPVLRNLNIKIPQGKKVAFVGESGTGKSTIAKLLLKFMNPQSGEIMINGYDLNDIETSYLRKKISYVPQKIELFSGTIFENLSMGNGIISLERVIDICRFCGVSELVDRLPNRYNTYLEEGGNNLSGGEKQKLAIARSLLSDSDIYVFDELTSNLDSFSEKKIQDIIFNKIHKKTVILIAHRISTIKNCDLIYYMESGDVIEQGTHEELIGLGGKYAAMVRLQSHENIYKESNVNINKFDNDMEEISYG